MLGPKNKARINNFRTPDHPVLGNYGRLSRRRHFTPESPNCSPKIRYPAGGRTGLSEASDYKERNQVFGL